MSSLRSGMVLLGAVAVLAAPALAWATDDCRDCHFGANSAPGAPDLAAYYSGGRAHHPVGVPYPLEGPADKGFNRPNGRTGELWFFDADADGIAGEGDIRLYGSPVPTVECGSCHRAHGEEAAVSPKPAAWLRIENQDSRLCTVCHRI